MSVITAIKPQKNMKRVNIYLDGDFGFGLDMENYVKLGLKVEQELSDNEIVKIIRKARYQKDLDKLLRFATLRPRSEKEIRDYFVKKKIHKSEREELFNKLKYFELIDDEKFSKWWVEQRQNFRPKAKRIIYQELRTKGIKKVIIESVLEGADIDEGKIARELLRKKAYKWESLEKAVARRKKSQYLAGKGFGWDVIEMVVKR